MYQKPLPITSIEELMALLDYLPSISLAEVPGRQVFLNTRARQVLQWPRPLLSRAQWAAWMDEEDNERRQELLAQWPAETDASGTAALTYWLTSSAGERLKIREEINRQPVDGLDVFVSSAFVLEKAEGQPVPDKADIIHSMQQGIEYLQACRDEDGIIVDFIFRFLNPQAFRMIDKKRELGDDILGRKILEVFPDFPQDDFLKYVQVVESGKPLEQEFVYPRQSENSRWYKQHVSSMGEGILVAYWSIDQRKAYEQELLEHNRLLDSIFDSTTVGLDVLRPLRDRKNKIYDFAYIKSNQQALETHHSYGVETTKGKTVLEVYPDLKDNGLFDTLVRVQKTGEAYRGEQRFRFTDQPRWFYFNYISFGEGILSSHLEISDSKNSREQLSKNNEFIEGIFNTASVAIDVLEPVRDAEGAILDFVYTRCNKKSEEIQQQSGKQHKRGKSLLSLYPNIPNNGFLQRLINVAERGQPVQMEVPYQMGGGVRWFLSEYCSFGNGGLILTYVDITRMKSAEDKLKGSLQQVMHNHTKLVRMIDNTDELICSVDTTMRFTGFNKTYQDNFEHVFGVRVRQGMKIEEATRSHPELSERMINIWKQAFAGEMQQEIKNFGSDEKSDYRISFHKIYGPRKELIGMTSVSRNLSHQKRIEKAIKDAKEFVLLSENLPNIVFTLNAEGKPEYFNDAFYNFTGFQKNVFDRIKLRKLVFADDLTKLTDVRQSYIIPSKPVDIESRFRLRHHSGQYRWVLLKLVPVLEEGTQLKSWLGSLTDIHEQVENESIQRRAAEEFRQIADGLPQLVWVTQPDGSATYFNEQWYRYTGTTATENMDKAWINRLHPQDQPATMQVWEHALRQGSTYHVEYRIQSHDGAYRWFMAQGIPLRNDQGHIEKWFGTCTDIDEQKNQRRQLQKQNEKLNQINEYLENYVNALAHNLRAPIVNIQSLLNLAKEEGHAHLREKVLKKLQLSADNLDDTVIGLVRLIEAQHRQQGDAELIDIKTCFDRVKQNHQREMEESKASVRYDLAVSEVRFLDHYLFDALENFLSNALKFRQEERPLEIVLKSWYEDQYTVVSFTDNGVGIDLKVHGQNLFKPFFRPSRRSDGKGLGLHLVYHVFRREGGKLEVASKPGAGTTFRMFIPREL